MATQQEILEAQQYLTQLKGSQLNQDPNRDWAAFDDYTTKLEAENRLAEQAAKPKETIFDKLKNVSSSFLTKGLGTVNPLIGLLSQSGTVQKAVGDFALGAAKTVPGTALGALGLVDVATKKLGGTPISEMTTPEVKSLEQTISKTEGGAQQAGYVAGEIAQFLMPVPGLEKAKAAGLIPRIATEAAEAGLKTAVQKGDVDKDVKTNALIAAAFPALGAGLKSVAPLASPTLKAVGEKIQNVIVKPNAKDIEKGFNVENIKKYDLGGTLSEMFEKANKRLNEYWGELQTKLQSAKNKGANVDLFESFYKTLDDLKKSKGKDFGDLNAIKRVTDNLASEIDEVSNKTGIVDILEAQNVKQGAGTKGAWVFGSADPDASAKEIVYDIFYSNLKKQIDEIAAQVGDEGINEINKKLSEIIPIKSALIRRMPVEERNQVLGLISNMSLLGSLFNPKALVLFGVDKLLKSGRFADFLLKASENAKNLKNVTGKAGSPVSRVFGGSVENPSSFGLGIEDVSKKPGFKSPAVGEAALIQEAKKYNSAEEFVNKQIPVFHGSRVPLKRFSNKKGGVFFTSEYADATGYSGGAENVYEGYLNFKKPLIIDAKGAKWDKLNTKYGKSTQEVIGKAEKDGYDGVVFKNIVDNVMDTEGMGKSTVYYAYKPEDAFLNESQLTDIWNKAHKKPPQSSKQNLTNQTTQTKTKNNLNIESFNNPAMGEIANYEKIKPLAIKTQTEINDIANKMINKYGGQLSDPGIKTKQSYTRKVMDELGGDETKITDTARNSIVHSDSERIYNIVKDDLKLKNKLVKSDYKFHETNGLGFQGGNIRVKGKSGIVGEIQVVSPEMVFAKESSDIAKSILGEVKYKEMLDKFGDIGGKGHKYYEDWRIIEDKTSKEAMRLAQDSKDYYKQFLK